MSVSEHMHVSDGRRFEVFTGAGRRRRLAEIEAAAIAEESCAGGNSVCGVARRHGLVPRLLFAGAGWPASGCPAPSSGHCSCPSW